jgi:hypothetical protein
VAHRKSGVLVMSLPRRIAKEPKRATRWRSQAHAAFVRSHECCVPGCTARPIEFAHVRLGSGAGMGQKPDDWRGVSLCKAHHDEQHRLGEASFWRVAGQNPEALIAAFIKASPRRAQIEQAMRERAHG